MIRVHDFVIRSARAPRAPQYDSIDQFDHLFLKEHLSGVKLPRVYLSGSFSRWTDCLNPKLSSLGLIFSERVIDAITSEGLTGLRWAKVDFDLSEARGLSKAPPCPYYMIRVTGRPPVLRYRIFERVGENFELRFETSDKNTDPRWKAKTFIPHTQTLRVEQGGGDAFMPVPDRTPSLLPFGAFYCSRRFVELAKKHDFSNFSFTPLDRIAPMPSDFRTYEWPPEKWYPMSQPPREFDRG